jgi:hypothetical protein
MTAASIAYESPITCCQAVQVSPLSSIPLISQCGATASITVPATATAIPALSLKCQPISARTSIAGSAQTQWCDQEIGEISSPANALIESTHTSSAWSRARRIPA